MRLDRSGQRYMTYFRPGTFGFSMKCRAFLLCIAGQSKCFSGPSGRMYTETRDGTRQVAVADSFPGIQTGYRLVHHILRCIKQEDRPTSTQRVLNIHGYSGSVAELAANCTCHRLPAGAKKETKIEAKRRIRGDGFILAIAQEKDGRWKRGGRQPTHADHIGKAPTLPVRQWLQETYGIAIMSVGNYYSREFKRNQHIAHISVYSRGLQGIASCKTFVCSSQLLWMTSKLGENHFTRESSTNNLTSQLNSRHK